MSKLSEQVTAIAIVYLGPAAHVFLERQAKTHLDGLQFANLEREHMAHLQYWVKISAGLVIDKAKAGELADRIGKL